MPRMQHVLDKRFDGANRTTCDSRFGVAVTTQHSEAPPYDTRSLRPCEETCVHMNKRALFV